MDNSLDTALEKLLKHYPDAQGVMFHSLELATSGHVGDHIDILEKYKDIPMMSIDESFSTRFSFIIAEGGTIIIFFLDDLHFISVFVTSEYPNKELATNMFEQFEDTFKSVITQLYEAESIH